MHSMTWQANSTGLCWIEKKKKLNQKGDHIFKEVFFFVICVDWVDSSVETFEYKAFVFKALYAQTNQRQTSNCRRDKKRQFVGSDVREP